MCSPSLKRTAVQNKGDCLGNTTDCDLEDIPGAVSLSTAHISHVPSRRGAMALTLRHSCEYTQNQVSSSVFLVNGWELQHEL